MPIRIYDIAKKLGIEAKDVLAKAKELGIAAAYPSSSLDRITGEFLENQLAASLPPPPPPPLPVPQQGTAAVPASTQQAKGHGFTIRTTSNEIHGLVKRILAGEIHFVFEVSEDEGSPPLRAKLVPESSSASVGMRPKLEPVPPADLDEHTKRIFLGTYYYASSVSEDGWVNLAEYGSTLKKQNPTFQAQDFGEKSLGGLVRRAGIFDIKTDGNTPPVYYIRPKHQAAINHPQSVMTTALEQMQPRRHATGKVHNLKLGFGFIAPDDGSDNAFFHATEVVGCTIFDLRPGDPVEYEAGVNEQGPCAWKVRRLSSTPS